MFVKEPKLGFVKTRLSKNCTKEFTLKLYQYFVKDLITTFKNSAHNFKLCIAGDFYNTTNAFGDFNNFLQVEGDLGIKMQKAFEQEFNKGYEKIILIGSDTPHLSHQIIEESFHQLNAHDSVIGPSLDGGYYLIGFNKNSFDSNAFTNIIYSTHTVMQQTLHKLHKKNIYLLQELNDIDYIEDLEKFYTQFKESYFKDSNTIKFLNTNTSWKR